MTRVLIVDDQQLVRAGLRGILHERYGFHIVGECASGAEVAGAVAQYRPDIVVMDVRMPGVDGVTATRELRADPNAPPVLMLTTFDDDEALAAGLRAGASGFLLKGVEAEDLHRAVRTVAEGGAWLDPAVTGRVLTTFRAAPARGPAARSGDVLAELTAREREVLALVGRGRTNAEIAAELVLSEGTVKSHLNRAFSKLGLRDRAAAVVLAFDSGLVTPRT